MEQTRALNALEPFLALSKSATSPRAAADLITRATSAPNTYIFTELLQTPQIQALASSDEFAPSLTLLRIFSYGTYSSYTTTTGLPALNDLQTLKLRQLSLLTLAKKDGSTANGASPSLGYASLQQALGLPSRQALEELVISAIYAGLIKAQLNPKDSLVQINSVAPLRDVAPAATNGLLSSLQAWAGRCDATVKSLSKQMTSIRNDANIRAAQAAARAQETHKLMESEKKVVPPSLRPRNKALPSLSQDPGFTPSLPGGGSNIINTATTTNPFTPTSTLPKNQMSNMLTDVVDSSNSRSGGSYLAFLDHRPGAAGTTPAAPAAPAMANLEVKPAMKRNSDEMAGEVDSSGGGVGGAGMGGGVGGGAGGVGDEGGMDVDGVDGEEGKKRRLEE
ncbi:hypothetical protein N0V88_003874 [Collariella sp. IMI 366227]|nr:hypothetical protein N0V88_003874 [Collariella sp. IMI 366227]